MAGLGVNATISSLEMLFESVYCAGSYYLRKKHGRVWDFPFNVSRCLPLWKYSCDFTVALFLQMLVKMLGN
jgi:hypothetical protein